jgi:polyhydroxyalkanoate synthesis regulator phasin
MADKRSTRGDTMRQAVDEAFQAAAGQAQVTRDRAQDLVDELSGAAGRLRDVLEDLRPAGSDDVRTLRAEVRALSKRVTELEQAAKPKPRAKPKPKPKPKKSA